MCLKKVANGVRRYHKLAPMLVDIYIANGCEKVPSFPVYGMVVRLLISIMH